tara:strand:- start:1552 stop:1821 length:270 start_codon:yes stop_codon:yes gene_type:complete
MEKDKQRMNEIQNLLVAHIQDNLKTDEDFMYMATMLLKHSMVLYKTFLEDDQIKKMLEHVGETLSDDLHNADKYFKMDDESGSTPPTMH